MNDNVLMQIAIDEAGKGEADLTYENPRVGAVIVKDGKVLGRGYHHRFGGHHAEIEAYQSLAKPSDIQGACIYVTLEPCASRGKVSSCAETMLTWGLKRVVIGSLDPNPSTNGKGLKLLREHGIEVIVLNDGASRQLNPAFHYFFEKNLPYVRLKVATSANRKVNAGSGQQTKITDSIADQDVHRLRAASSAILVGSETFLIDQPNLTVRKIALQHEQPLRIVLDRSGRFKDLPIQWRDNYLIFTSDEGFAETSPRVKLYDGSIADLLAILAELGIQSLLVEGGPIVHAAFLQESAWQEFWHYQSDSDFPDEGLSAVLPASEPALLRQQVPVGNTIRYIYRNEVL